MRSMRIEFGRIGPEKRLSKRTVRGHALQERWAAMTPKAAASSCGRGPSCELALGCRAGKIHWVVRGCTRRRQYMAGVAAEWRNIAARPTEIMKATTGLDPKDRVCPAVHVSWPWGCAGDEASSGDEQLG